MRISFLLYKMAFVALAVVTFTGCKRENGIDNDTVIQKPYSLYIGSNSGSLVHTNTGEDFKTIFTPDGYPIRAISTSAENILFVKRNVHLSEDNGKNFNPTDSSVNAFYLGLDGQFGKPYIPWPSIILNAPDQGRVYLLSTKGRGIIYSENNGKNWVIDDQWDEFLTHSFYTSMVRLKNGKIFAHSYVSDSIYVRDNKDDKWSYVQPVDALPKATWYLSRFNDALIATDMSGVEGVYRSDDEGKKWIKYNGLPSGMLYATAAPFDQTILVGTEDKGIYRLQGGQFIPSNNGLETNTTVYGITGKDELFKNEISREFVYIATNKGVYRSEDKGNNWIRVLEGSFVQVY